ncbi:N-acetyltransferase [Bradyrhizobium prioriisuperbiae]|uniref:GNAT family N-acetyltransferase n=1 Tax=Bradyrhizobium prioriisuperbiae TaxID=2854389 RepID=UPI0028E191D3|nr:N-acetyltransferase [Bradyrhizobium prioritasuperba]
MITTRPATPDDVETISALLTANAADHGGMLLGDWSAGVIMDWLDAGQLIIVATSEAGLIGALLTEDKVHVSAPPVVAMFRAWPGGDDAYGYGPVCIDRAARGQGVLEALYRDLVARRPDREAVLFIRADNPRSLSAHLRLGMREVAGFVLDGEDFIVLSTRPASSPG